MTGADRTSAAARLEACALRLFDEHGYNEVTTEQVAAAAGVTQRTFFRHFPNKAAVVFGRFDESTAEFTNLLYQQPAELTITAALINAIAAQDRATPVGADDARRVRIVRNTPSLGDAIRAFEADFEAMLGDWIAQRHHRDADDFDVRVAAATLVAARRVAMNEWQRHEGRVSIIEIARRAVASIDPHLPPHPTTRD